MKNASLRDISFLAAGILSGISVIILCILNWIGPFFDWYLILILAILSFGFTFLVFYILMDKFVYRRIKLIYKTIHQFKLGEQKPTEVKGDLIEDVEQRVKDFSIKKAAEIAELKKMEQFRKEFLGDVSHELKTPIFNTQGYIETLLEGAIENPDVNRSYLLKASKNLDRLTTIVEDLVSISQHESGEMTLNQTRFDIVELLNQVYENHEMTADNKDIALSIKSGNLSTAFVYGDKKRIEIAFNNLVNNAIQYGNENGGKVETGIYNMDDKILIEITDNGPGIEAQHLPRLFERFYRVDKHRARYEGGNGLGLAICKHIIEAHKNTIHVRSTVGIGTTLGFTLDKSPSNIPTNNNTFQIF